jgi:hypothetical protein
MRASTVGCRVWIGVVTVWVSKHHLRIFVYSLRFLAVLNSRCRCEVSFHVFVTVHSLHIFATIAPPGGVHFRLQLQLSQVCAKSVQFSHTTPVYTYNTVCERPLNQIQQRIRTHTTHTHSPHTGTRPLMPRRRGRHEMCSHACCGVR